MEIAIFAKKYTSPTTGKPFYRYLSTLTRKSDGNKQTVTVKFRDECGEPKAERCPMNIIIPKGSANLTEKTYHREDEDGNEVTGIAYTLWVSKWDEGKPYEDHSLDDYE